MDHLDLAKRIAAFVSYLTSGGLVLGDLLQWLNNNAAAVGALMAICTFIVNAYYARKSALRKIEEARSK